MILSLIVAIADDGAMGRNNQLPWHLPADLKFFKETTLGRPVIMGRRTWESLGKPLPGRLNIVLSSHSLNLPEGVLLYSNLDAALERAQQEPGEEVFIIGGSQVFAEAMPQLQRMYITRIHTKVPDADTVFPHVDHSQWMLAWERPHAADDRHAYPFEFQLWERISL